MMLDQYNAKKHRMIFFAYKELWEYMPCVNKRYYVEQKSYGQDMELVKELLEGY